MIETWLQKIKNYRVLVVGDAIMDEYCYVTPLGKSPKENIIATKYVEREIFHGGVWAAGAHVQQFCGVVNVLRGANITTKRRFVEKTYMRKLFEVHEETHGNTPPWRHTYEDYDLVIVTDFGHGTVTKAMIEEISAKARFLAVNAQTNSANFGFNLITKYPRADFVVIDEAEARLAAHERDGEIEYVIEKLGFPYIIVTQGHRGCTGYDGEKFYHEPAIAHEIVDTMGAGDAFFCVTAPLAKAGAPMGELLRIGNAAGAVKVGTVGNREPVTKKGLLSALGLSPGK